MTKRLVISIMVGGITGALIGVFGRDVLGITDQNAYLTPGSIGSAIGATLAVVCYYWFARK